MRIRGQGNINMVANAISSYEKSKIDKSCNTNKCATVLGFTDLSYLSKTTLVTFFVD